MKQMEPKRKDKYEPPEVRDIAPVTIVNVTGESGGAGDDETMGNYD